MDKRFLLVFSLFCCIEAVTLLKCITCHLRMKSDRCRRGYGVCLAQRDESCMLLRIYKDYALQLSYMVCQRFCRNLTFTFSNRTYIHHCCEADYCNKR
ncbi:prostate and testis expressed protein 3 [Pipistrellus kuhlii]|uniref:Prostate and testis expressed 3 n=1 Tax=Pipistrellus kuhlii TaxID=59472 RepID=A0A7J7UH00_PIPKU|nr:prostate and testis expressed protein 3 [Pipistrellus kuhlii]KAF6312061.1 prostate and testis expressed 3 [Pipistrellus kuhlii]